MEFTLNLKQNPTYGGDIAPNTVRVKVISDPVTYNTDEFEEPVEGLQNGDKAVKINYDVFFKGTIGEGNNAREEYISFRNGGENHYLKHELLPFFWDIEGNKTTINAIIGAFTFKGFLNGFVMELEESENEE